MAIHRTKHTTEQTTSRIQDSKKTIKKNSKTIL